MTTTARRERVIALGALSAMGEATLRLYSPATNSDSKTVKLP